MTSRPVQTESGELPPGWTAERSTPSVRRPRRRRRRGQAAGEHERELREALISIVEALEADEPEGLRDAYEAACGAVQLRPRALGGWVERAAELREIEARR